MAKASTSSLLTALCALQLGCEPVRRSEVCHDLVASLEPINGAKIHAEKPEDFEKAAKRVRKATSQLMQGSSKEETIEKLRSEVLSTLEALEASLKKAGKPPKGRGQNRSYDLQKARIEQLVQQLGGISGRVNAACR